MGGSQIKKMAGNATMWQCGWQQCFGTEQAAGPIQPAAAVLLSWQPWQHFPRHQDDPGIPGFHIRKLPRLSSLFVKPNYEQSISSLSILTRN